MRILEAVSGALEILGAGLVALAGIGLLRLPDALTRATAVSKAATLGVLLLLFGALLDEPGWRTTGIVALVVVVHLVTVPLSGLAVGRAAYLSGTARPPVTRLDEPVARGDRPGSAADRPSGADDTDGTAHDPGGS